MTELEGLIHFWKATLKGTRWLLPLSTQAHIENTIKKLEELNKLMRERK